MLQSFLGKFPQFIIRVIFGPIAQQYRAATPGCGACGDDVPGVRKGQFGAIVKIKLALKGVVDDAVAQQLKYPRTDNCDWYHLVIPFGWSVAIEGNKARRGSRREGDNAGVERG